MPGKMSLERREVSTTRGLEGVCAEQGDVATRITSPIQRPVGGGRRSIRRRHRDVPVEKHRGNYSRVCNPRGRDPGVACLRATSWMEPFDRTSRTMTGHHYTAVWVLL